MQLGVQYMSSNPWDWDFIVYEQVQTTMFWVLGAGLLSVHAQCLQVKGELFSSYLPLQTTSKTVQVSYHGDKSN